MVHFFDIHYVKGFDWYQQFYTDYAGEKAIGDTTVSYVRDPSVPRRIAEFDSNAKLLFSLRNPIDRAFSHYWHEKKKRKIAFKFEEVFTNYDLYQSWVVPGFYYQHLERFYKYFPKEHVLVILVDDIEKDPQATIRQVFAFLGVDAHFVPSVLHRRANTAWYQPVGLEKAEQNLRTLLVKPIWELMPEQVRKSVQNRYFGRLSLGKIESEYDRGMDKDVRAQLHEIFRPENEKLAELINRDLSFWR